MIDYLLPYNLCIPLYCIIGMCISWYFKKDVYITDVLTVIIVTIIFSKQFYVLISLSSSLCTFILCFYRLQYIAWFRKLF